MDGKIFVITGTSGSGKTTLANNVLNDTSMNISKVVTYTTRSLRGNEKNKVHYNFVSRECFEKLISENKFFEYAEVYGNYYGSLTSDVEKIIKSGKNVLFVIDVQGAENLKNSNKGIVTIFITAPSFSELKKRLEKRAEDSKEKILERLLVAEKEEEKKYLFDYVLINDEVRKAIIELKAIIKKHC
jgi:guanylate kinase